MPGPVATLLRIATFPLGIFLAGLVWAFVDVFLLGHWDPKFGPGASFTMDLALVGFVAAWSILPAAALLLLLPRGVRDWSLRRHLAIGAAAGGTAMSILVVLTRIPFPGFGAGAWGALVVVVVLLTGTYTVAILVGGCFPTARVRD